MGSNRRWILLTCLMGVRSAGASPPMETSAEVESAQTHGAELLDRLQGQSLTLRPVDEGRVGPVSGESCAWYSVVIGHRAEDGSWAHIERSFSVESPVQFDTPLGRMRLGWRTIRPHLVPLWEKTLTTSDELGAEMDPDLKMELTARLESGSEAITLSESCLVSGHAISARVVTETYLLPPSGPDAEPGTGHHTVLQLSNGEWEADGPVLPRTPPFDDWSY